MASSKEKPPKKDGSGERKGTDSSTPSSSEENFSIMDSMFSYIRLNALKRSRGVEGVDSEKLGELQEGLVSKDSEKKEKAEKEINNIFQNILEVDNEVEDGASLADVFGGIKGVEKDTRELAESVDSMVSEVRKKQEEGKVNEKEISESIALLGELSKKAGIELPEGKKVKQALENDMAELLSMRDRVRVSQYEKQAREMTGGIGGLEDKFEKEILESEDLKEAGSRKEDDRKLKVRKGKDRADAQSRVDAFLDDVRQDFTKERLAKLNSEDLLSRVSEVKEHARNARQYGDSDQVREAYNLLFKISRAYTGKLSEKLAVEALKGLEIDESRRGVVESLVKGAATHRVNELWAKKGEINTERDFREVRKYLEDGAEEAVLLIGNEKKFIEQRDELEREEEDHRREYLLRGRDAISEGLGDVESLRYSDSPFLKELEEHIGKGDLDSYLKSLLSYLYKVGLREGMNDFRLNELMTRARVQLAESGGPHKDLYDGFRKLSTFHEAFTHIRGAEQLAEALNSIGVEPSKAWLGEKGNQLSTEVEINGERKNLAVWNYNDMMQSEKWAYELMYTSAGDQEEVYDQMLLNQLYGEGEYKIENNQLFRRDLGSKTWDTNPVERDLSRTLPVGGPGGEPKKISINKLIEDHRWMAAIAHDIWKYSGRWAQVLDNVDIGSAKLNKGLLALYKTRRYCEQYGIVDPYLYKPMELDGLIYSFENYKGLVGKGLERVFKDAGYEDLNVTKKKGEPTIDKKAKEVLGVVHNKLKRKRVIDGEEFYTNYVPQEDVSMLVHTKSYWQGNQGYERAKQEYDRRQKSMGRTIDWSREEEAYRHQIEMLRNRWEDMALTEDELTEVRSLDWNKINRAYEKRLNLKEGSIGDTYEDFIKNFSYSKMTDYDTLRDSDYGDYGDYMIKASKVNAVFKAGFKNGSTEAMNEALGNIISYQTYDDSGYRRFAPIMWTHIYDLRAKKLVGNYTYDMQTENGDLKGDKLPNGEFVVNENGQWVADWEYMMEGGKWTRKEKKKQHEVLINTSLLEKKRNILSLGERDVEYAVWAAVANGILGKKHALEFLDKRYGGPLNRIPYGGRFFRWFKRTFIFDDWWYFADALGQEGKKSLDSFLKYVFSS